MKSSKRNVPKTDLFPKSSIWCGSRGIKYSEEFRDALYKINPVYISCMYKHMFEANAVQNLRQMEGDGIESDKDENNNKDGYHVSRDDASSAGYSRDVNEVKRLSRKSSMSDGLLTEKTNRNSNTPLSLVIQANNSRRNKDKDCQGWEVCSRPHSLSNTPYKRFYDFEMPDYFKSRSLSANACLLPIKRDKDNTPKSQNSRLKLVANPSLSRVHIDRLHPDNFLQTLFVTDQFYPFDPRFVHINEVGSEIAVYYYTNG
ncbi:hypothetical protein FSP39_025519 [Pinctada imbricata]|uniref:Uncharacterized protein n=1 Tax=Pinctada imbricata TaxID=66713 RepID=A0AA88YGG8_PINIB|nr:hypothetical protein FSP39_025519 [Pinctada imbricata]